MEVILIVGFVLMLIGIYKMKYRGETFKGLAYTIVGMVIISFGTSIGDTDKPESSRPAQKIEREIESEAREQLIDSMNESSREPQNPNPNGNVDADNSERGEEVSPR